MMAKRNISVKFLIRLVGERPALWDKTSDDYKDRALKEPSWSVICTFINENYNSMPIKAKEEFTKMIMKKWSHIRDSWVKSMKYGYDPITKKPPKPYIYHNELKFMQKILECRPPCFNLNMSQLSNMSFEDFYREKNETENSNETSHEMENNDNDENEEIGDISIENYNQEENESNNKAEEDVYDVDDWDFEASEITSIMDQENNRKTEPMKMKRQSKFVSNRKKCEYEETNLMLPATSSILLPLKRLQRNYKINHRSLYKTRHCNFFKGILPSVNGLDEEYVLQFQSGVIALLQKIRESQKRKFSSKSNRLSSHSLFKCRDRKHKTSLNSHDRATHNTNAKKKSRRQISDPIAAEEEHSETEYSSES